ncbi:ComF family protein [Marinomonas agarivorans]|nr:ComF family protein [Marinomonas agarivorans]
MKTLTLSITKKAKVYYRSNKKQCFCCNTPSRHTLCDICQNGIEENALCCRLCQEPTATSLTLCGKCQVCPPKYHQVIAPYLYQGLIQALIKRLKFANNTYSAQLLCELLTPKLIDYYSQHGNNIWPQALIYVPSHPRRIRERGFCHMALLAKTLAKQLPVEVAILKNSLIKQLHQPAQHTQDKQQRQKMNNKTFFLQGYLPEYIVLLDDVMTTGTTVNTCVATLLSSGPKKIDVWCFARTAAF